MPCDGKLWHELRAVVSPSAVAVAALDAYPFENPAAMQDVAAT